MGMLDLITRNTPWSEAVQKSEGMTPAGVRRNLGFEIPQRCHCSCQGSPKSPKEYQINLSGCFLGAASPSCGNISSYSPSR